MTDVVAGEVPWRLRLAVITAMHAAGTMNISALLVLAAPVQRELELSTTAFGLILSGYYGALAVCSLAAGALVDRMGIGRAMLGAAMLLVCGLMALALSGSWSQAIGGAMVMGAGYGFVNPAGAKGVLDWVPYRHRGTAMGIKQIGVSVGGVLAALLAMAAGPLGWRVVMVAVAALTVACALPCVAFGKAPARAPRAERIGNWSVLLRNHRLHVVNGATAGLNICQGSFFAFLALFLRSGLELGQPLAAAGFAAAQAGGAAGRLLWGIVSDRWFGHRRVLIMALVAGAASALLALMAAIGVGSALAALLGAVALGLTVASYPALSQTIVVEQVRPEQAGSATGLHLFTISAAGIVGPPVIGAIIDTTGGFAAAWLALAGVAAVSTVLLIAVHRSSWPASGDRTS